MSLVPNKLPSIGSTGGYLATLPIRIFFLSFLLVRAVLGFTFETVMAMFEMLFIEIDFEALKKAQEEARRGDL